MVSILEWDQKATIWLNNTGAPWADAFWLWITEASSWYWMYAFVIALYFLLERWWGLVTLAFTLITFGLADWISVNGFKNVFERLRPCHQEGVMEFIRLVPEGCGGQFGFVSSHAANTFALAFFFGHFFRRFWKASPWIFWLWCVLSAYSRVYLGVHYLGDILGGAILGTAIGWIVWTAYGQMENRFRPLSL